MAGSIRDGNVPAKREEGAVEIYSKRLNNRSRALVDQAFDLLEKGRTDKMGRDFVAALADAMLADPLGAVERVQKMTIQPKEGEGPGKAMNINNLYLLATQQANQDASKMLDVTPLDEGTARVQPRLTD